MKKTWIGCLLVLLSLESATWSQEKQTGGGTEKAVAALEQQWLRAQTTNNSDLLAPLLADKVVVTEADGKVSGKAETLATYKKTKWDSAEYNDVISAPQCFKSLRPNVAPASCRPLLKLKVVAGRKPALRQRSRNFGWTM